MRDKNVERLRTAIIWMESRELHHMPDIAWFIGEVEGVIESELKEKQ